MTEQTPAEQAAPGYAHTTAYVGGEIAAGRLRLATISLARGLVFEAVLTRRQRVTAAVETFAVAAVLLAVAASPLLLVAGLVFVALRFR